MKKSVCAGIILLIIFAWSTWPNKLPDVATNNDTDTNLSKIDLLEKTRLPDRETKFLPENQIKANPKLSEKESDELVKKVPAPALSKELHDELGEVRKNGYGSIPPVDLENNPNPQKSSVIEAIKTGKHPERLSIVGKREKFDYEKYKQNPNDYLDVVVPSRALDSAQPGKDVKRLTRVSSQYIETYQDETVELTITGAESGAPISATVFDGGKFHNDLSAITVQADGSGSATLRFTPTTGVIMNTRITVASPLSSGVVHFNVYVKKKREEIQ